MSTIRNASFAVAIAISIAYLLSFPPEAANGDRLSVIPDDAVAIDNAFYDTEAWDKLWYHQDNPLLLYNNARLPFFIDKLRDLKPGAKVLDVACGAGLLTEALAKALPHVSFVGLDQGQRMVNAANKHAQTVGITNVKYIAGSAYTLPLEDASFDAVVSSDAAEHMHDLNAYMREISRVTRASGLFVFDTINRTWQSKLISYWLAQRIGRILPPHTHHYKLFITPSEMKSLLEAYGYEAAPISSIHGMRPTLRPVHFAKTILQTGLRPLVDDPTIRWSLVGPFVPTADTSQSYGLSEGL